MADRGEEHGLLAIPILQLQHELRQVGVGLGEHASLLVDLPIERAGGSAEPAGSGPLAVSIRDLLLQRQPCRAATLIPNAP